MAAGHQGHEQGRARRMLGLVAGPGRQLLHLGREITHQQRLLRRAHPADDARVLPAGKGGRRAAYPVLHPHFELKAIPLEQAQVKTTGVHQVRHLLVDQLAQAVQVELGAHDGQAGLGQRRQLR